MSTDFTVKTDRQDRVIVPAIHNSGQFSDGHRAHEEQFVGQDHDLPGGRLR